MTMRTIFGGCVALTPSWMKKRRRAVMKVMRLTLMELPTVAITRITGCTQFWTTCFLSLSVYPESEALVQPI